MPKCADDHRVRPPGDAVVLQQIAICYTRIGMADEAAKTYRHVLQKTPEAAGAHYGLAFILLRSETPNESIPHLEAFLAHAPDDDEADNATARDQAVDKVGAKLVTDGRCATATSSSSIRTGEQKLLASLFFIVFMMIQYGSESFVSFRRMK